MSGSIIGVQLKMAFMFIFFFYEERWRVVDGFVIARGKHFLIMRVFLVARWERKSDVRSGHSVSKICT